MGVKSESLKVRFQNNLLRLHNLVPMEDFILGELLECKRVLRFQIRVPVHTGGTQHLIAFIAHHCNPYKTGEDPYKGGLRKDPWVDQETTEGLAMDMTLKEGVADLPLGGGKSSIQTKPNFPYSPRDHANMNKAFVTEADKVRMLGPRIYSTASDMGTTEFDCDTIAREYIALHETELGSKRGVATGKSVSEFGNPARKKATGRGGLIVARKMLTLMGRSKNNMTMAIDGFGNVGLPCFELATEYGFKPIAVCDINGGIYNAGGLNVKEVLQHYQERRTFADFREADAITNEEIMAIDCDVLVPASTQNRLTDVSAPSVKTKYLLELANGPTTDTGEKILTDRGVIIIPDILANAGGVIISWIELNINKEHDRHSVSICDEEESSNKMLQDIMHFNTQSVHELASARKLSLRDAAFTLALLRIIPRLQNKHLLYL